MSADEHVKYWNGPVGALWADEQERLDRQLDPLGRAALAALEPRRGEHILDVGCGSGQTTLQLAEAVGASGRVVGVDISEPLLAAAARRNTYEHVSFLRADAETHRFERGFDAIYSRFGTMFFADPVAAFGKLRSALQPGGRMAFVCWRSMAENPLFTAPMEAAAKRLPPLPPPDPNLPDPFAFAERARVAQILEAAGFDGVGIAPHDQRIGGQDLAATADLAMKMGPLGRFLRQHPEQRHVVIDAVREAIEPFIVDGVARVPSATWIVTATSS
jgi:SAM-dependent methyltransferase